MLVSMVNTFNDCGLTRICTRSEETEIQGKSNDPEECGDLYPVPGYKQPGPERSREYENQT